MTKKGAGITGKDVASSKCRQSAKILRTAKTSLSSTTKIFLLSRPEKNFTGEAEQ